MRQNGPQYFIDIIQPFSDKRTHRHVHSLQIQHSIISDTLVKWKEKSLSSLALPDKMDHIWRSFCCPRVTLWVSSATFEDNQSQCGIFEEIAENAMKLRCLVADRKERQSMPSTCGYSPVSILHRPATFLHNQKRTRAIYPPFWKSVGELISSKRGCNVDISSIWLMTNDCIHASSFGPQHAFEGAALSKLQLCRSFACLSMIINRIFVSVFQRSMESYDDLPPSTLAALITFIATGTRLVSSYSFTTVTCAMLPILLQSLLTWNLMRFTTWVLWVM